MTKIHKRIWDIARLPLGTMVSMPRHIDVCSNGKIVELFEGEPEYDEHIKRRQQEDKQCTS